MRHSVCLAQKFSRRGPFWRQRRQPHKGDGRGSRFDAPSNQEVHFCRLILVNNSNPSELFDSVSKKERKAPHKKCDVSDGCLHARLVQEPFRIHKTNVVAGKKRCISHLVRSVDVAHSLTIRRCWMYNTRRAGIPSHQRPLVRTL